MSRPIIQHNKLTKQIVYRFERPQSDEKESKPMCDIDVIDIDNNNAETDSHAPINLRKWQRVVNDYTLKDIDDIIDALDSLVNEQPMNQEARTALAEANKAKFNESLSNRSKIVIKRFVDSKQFSDSIQMNYDKDLDGHCKILIESRKHFTKMEKHPVKDAAPKDWQTKVINAVTLESAKRLPGSESGSVLEWFRK